MKKIPNSSSYRQLSVALVASYHGRGSEKKLRPRHTSRVASLLAYRAKLLAPSPASTLSSTNLHLITFCPASPGWNFSRLFSQLTSRCVCKSSGAVGFDLRDSFPCIVFFCSVVSFFFLFLNSASGFSLPLSCSSCVPPQPPQKRCKLSQGPDLPTTYSCLSTRLDPTRFISSIFRRPVGSSSACLVFYFSPSVF